MKVERKLASKTGCLLVLFVFFPGSSDPQMNDEHLKKRAG